MIAPIACTTGHLDQAAKPGTLADPRWQLRSVRMSVAGTERAAGTGGG